MEPSELLKAGKVAEFNALRNMDTKIDLFAADLAGAQISGVDLSGLDLRKADLSEADLSEAVLARADLSEADLSGTNLNGVLALKSRWRDAYLEESDLTDGDFTGADFNGAEFSGCTLSGAIFANAKLKNATVSSSNFAGADFTDARLSGANLSGSDLRNTVLREAKLNYANLSCTTLTSADLTRAQLSHANLSEADLSEARFVSANLNHAVVTDANFKGADFSRTDLSAVELAPDQLKSGTFVEAQLDAAHASAAVAPVPKPNIIMVEQPDVVINGRAIAVLWENAESEGVGRLRLAVGRLGCKYRQSPQALPVPADLVIARSVAAWGTGFGVLVIVERPSGVIANLFRVTDEGVISPPISTPMPYTPAVRPLLVGNGDAPPSLYGISREGPGLMVHRFNPDATPSTEEDNEGALVRHHGSSLSTARGFASSQYPVVLTRGGMLIELSDRGPKEPTRAPSGFPGRSCSLYPTDGGLQLTWNSQGEKGFKTAFCLTGQAPEESQVLPKTGVVSVDSCLVDGVSWAVFTQPPEKKMGSMSAWAMIMPFGEPIELVDDDREVDELCIVRDSGPDGQNPYVFITDMTGSLEVFILRKGGGKSKWKIGNA